MHCSAKAAGIEYLCEFESHRFRQFQEPVAQRNESAALRRPRSHVQIVPGSPVFYGVAKQVRHESLKLATRRFESYLRSQILYAPLAERNKALVF
jgi:hypothetical protein